MIIVRSQSELKNVQSQLGIEKTDIAQSHYHPLVLASPDAYLEYEDASGSIKYLQGKIWTQKFFHPGGMTEFILAQEKKIDAGYGDWVPLLYRSIDPDVSITSLFDKVPRIYVDPKAGNRLTRIGYSILTLIIMILLWWIIGDVEVNPTITFFLMIFFAAFSVTLLLFYEMKSQREDLVDAATLFVDGPSVSIARSYTHPYSGEIKRFMGEITPVAVKSSKVSFQKIRGYTISQMSDSISYYNDQRKLKERIQEAELGYIDALNEDNLTEERRVSIEEEYSKISAEIAEEALVILKKHGSIAQTEKLYEFIDEVRKQLQDEAYQQKIRSELQQRREEIENIYGELAQAQYERDSNEQELRRWMQSANEDLNKSDALIATKFAKLLRQGGLVESYQSSLPQKPTQNGNLVSAGTSFIPFIVVLIIGYSIFSSINKALDNMGEWASFLFLLMMWLFAIFTALFTFSYVKSRLVDKMNNTESSRKVVMG